MTDIFLFYNKFNLYLEITNIIGDNWIKDEGFQKKGFKEGFFDKI